MDSKNKIAIVINDGLLSWQKLNVASFLASAIAIQFPETHGKPFVNASKNEFLPFINQPMLIYKSENQQQTDRAYLRAKERALSIGIFTEALFATKSEADNHEEIGKYTDEEQTIVGLVIYGDSKKVSKALNGLRFHS